MIDLISQYVDNADFTSLFVEELGWNRPTGRTLTVEVDGTSHVLTEAAALKGITVWACLGVPDGRTQREIDRHAKKESTERLLIFHDTDRQQWKWPQTRDSSGAGAARLVTHDHHVGRGNAALAQRLGMIEVGLEEDPTVVEVNRRLRRAFDADKVTKRFYGAFAKHQEILCSGIEGIDSGTDPDSRESKVRWYGSLLMNRLMFIYFMQRKGFLDNDPDYLRTRLQRLQGMSRPGTFYEFYKDFLVPLFHEGLGATESGREIDEPDIVALIGDVPYVNGGIFAEHPIEAAHDIRVPDHVFEGLFDFFDSWQWHLDDRPSGNPNEVNPDVLGYIFEQFINHQEEVATGSKAAKKNADKGAYYTKEDVTGYMTTSTLVPVFLERLEALGGVNPWRLVAARPDDYIWPSVRWGEVTSNAGTSGDGTPGQPGDPPPTDSGLPAESRAEYDDRMQHLADLRARMAGGHVRSVADTITNNIDIEALAIDCIDALDTPADVVRAWEILTDIKVVDPTCGSGAFLFAALGVLHRLYSAVLDAAQTHQRTKDTKALGDILSSVHAHPNRDYYVLKHAALNNLYGVDIMPEAVEIARLRLFLKLVAQIDDRRDLEPLPDLEFNIRPGNILVGALDEDSIRDRVDVLNAPKVDEVVDQAAELRAQYRLFSEAQEGGDDEGVKAAKKTLTLRSNDVRARLDRWWQGGDDETTNHDIRRWIDIHRPFHWFVEFPAVMERGGFDVVIGNPPYVRTTRIDYVYSGFVTDEVRDIYAPCLERACQVTSPAGRLAMIVPMNLSWGGDYTLARHVLRDRFASLWPSTYDQMPSRLFEGVGTRNTIIITGPDTTERSDGTTDPRGLHTTSFNKWPAEFRPHLMEVQRYIRHDKAMPEPWPKVGHRSLIAFATARPRGLGSLPGRSTSQHRLGYKKTANYWISVFVEDPPCLDAQRQPMPQKEVGDLYFATAEEMYAGFAVIASRTMFLWWIMTGDAFHVVPSIFERFPVAPGDLGDGDFSGLVEVGRQLHKRLESDGDHLLWTPYAGCWYGNFDLMRCRDITDQADEILLRHLGLTDAHDDFEVELWNYHKSGGERPGTVRGAKPDRDRS